jgi:hypothetical protein
MRAAPIGLSRLTAEAGMAGRSAACMACRQVQPAGPREAAAAVAVPAGPREAAAAEAVPAVPREAAVVPVLPRVVAAAKAVQPGALAAVAAPQAVAVLPVAPQPGAVVAVLPVAPQPEEAVGLGVSQRAVAAAVSGALQLEAERLGGRLPAEPVAPRAGWALQRPMVPPEPAAKRPAAAVGRWRPARPIPVWRRSAERQAS